MRKVGRSPKTNAEATKNEEIEEVVKAVKAIKEKLAESPEPLGI